MDNEDLTGNLAVCSRGRIGIIQGRKQLEWGLSWVGVGLFDNELWASRSPVVISESDQLILTEAYPLVTN